MSFTSRAFAIAFFVIAASPLAAHAQDAGPARLAAGIWTGTVAPPNEGSVDVAFDVSYKGDTLGIVLVAGEHGQFTLNELEFTGTKLSFSFTPGPVVICVLTPAETGGYAGECTDDGGTVVPMTMVPPAKESNGTKDAKTPESAG